MEVTKADVQPTLRELATIINDKHRMAETGGDVVIASPAQFLNNVAAQRAALPKWDDKNWKGLTYHEPGYYKKKAEEAAKQAASKQPASKQTAAR